MLNRLQLWPGWLRLGLLFAAGGVMGWFQAPYNFWWLGFLVFPLLAAAIITAPTARAAFARGWVFAFGYFLFGLYWIASALFVDISQFWWALPLAVAALPMGLALFWAAACAGVQRYGGRGLGQVLALAVALGVAEWLRGHLFTGFPWLLLGYVWVDVALVRGLAATFGAYGLTLWALLAAMLPVVVFMPLRRNARFAAGLLAVLLVAAPFINPQPAVQADNGTLAVRLVQPNIDQALKLDPQQREANLARLVNLSRAPGSYHVLVWPETAVPFRLTERADVRQYIAAALKPGSVLLTGAVRYEQGRYYNSVMALTAAAEVVGSYDKSHLVPFGEYIPFRSLLPFDPVAGGVDFSAGPGPDALTLNGVPSVGPLVCYEVIFPGNTVNRNNRPQWLLNVTNDGWYGLTHGPYQHFAISRLRAVEEGVPLVRVANTGISGIIDATGNVLTQTQLGETAVLDASFQLVTRETYYGDLGHMGDLPLFVVLILLIFMINRQSRSEKKLPL